MADDEEYCLRLEKIIDKQDGLLNHYDAKFNQQNSLNDALSRQNKILKEDLQKHKNLLKDMKKNIDQHKNVVNKLKKELEEQLKIQQNLHKDYGEVIKELTDELELQEKQKEEIQNKTKQIGMLKKNQKKLLMKFQKTIKKILLLLQLIIMFQKQMRINVLNVVQ